MDKDAFLKILGINVDISNKNEEGLEQFKHDNYRRSAERELPLDAGNVRKPKRRSVALDAQEVKSELQKPCRCILSCNKHFASHEIMYWRLKIHTLPEGEEKMQKLIEILKLSSTSLRKHERNQLFRVNQKLCCRTFFINTLLKVSVATFTRARRALFEDRVQVCDDSPKQLTHSLRGKVCEGFIRHYMETACDRDPTGLIYRMPVGMTKKDLHSFYKTIHDDGLEKSEFYKILHDKFKDLSFSKNQRFTKCTDCHNFRLLIEKEKDPNAKALLIAKRNLHLKEQQLEREAYYVRRAQAEMRPLSVLSLILDGMDQSKTDLPHYALWNQPSAAGTQKLKTHIVGSIVHGRQKYFFLDHNEVPHDTNLTLSCLMKILREEAVEGVLPPTLYVQLDNTARENKNKYFVGMMAYLVKQNYFKEVYISFLYVGHTHEDIDQCFSKISQKLKHTDALTMDEMIDAVRASQTPAPNVKTTDTVWDIKSWLEGCINHVQNVTYPKLYRIFKDETGHVTVQYKKTSVEDEWHPIASEGPLEIFRLDNKGNQEQPIGEPKVVEPKVDEDEITDLRRSLRKDFQLAQFSRERIEWWDKFLEEPTTNDRDIWPTFKETTAVPPLSSLSEKELELIRKYDDKRQDFREVVTKQQNADRRNYCIDDMILYKLDINENDAHVGKVLSKKESFLEVRSYKKRQEKMIETNTVRLVNISMCFPGGFKLTNSGNIPACVKQKLTANKLKLQ